MLSSKKIEFYSDLISWEECLPLWKKLWRHRLTPIEPVSHMKFLGGYSQELGEPYFVGAFINSQLVGCNSFHRVDNTIRSRGLYVEPEYRRMGIGYYLLNEVVHLAPRGMVWSFPRESALPVYLKAGFACSNEYVLNDAKTQFNFYVSHFKQRPTFAQADAHVFEKLKRRFFL